jgi:hypothetical protein
VRELVETHRDQVGVAEQDVGGLVHGVGQHETGRRPAGRLGLGLDGGVAVQLGVADQAQEGQHQLVEGGHGAVGEDRRPVGVDARGQVVGDDAADRGGQLPARLSIGHHLVVGDHHDHLDAEVLQPDAVREGAQVVPDVQRSGGPVTGQDPELPRCSLELILERAAALERGSLRAGAVRHRWSPRMRRPTRRSSPAVRWSREGCREGQPRT